MAEYYIGIFVIFVLLFVAGLGLLVRGYRKYDFHPLALLVPFVGAAFSFPVYYALKERYLRKNNASEEEVKCAKRFTVLGFVFIGAMAAVSFVAGIWFFLDKFAATDAGGDVEAAVWAKRLFWSLLAVCSVYVVSLLCLRRRKR